MLLIPAVDIKGGKAVRLKQGLADQQTVYDDDPVHAARRWVEGGARRIHIVDLDGAFEGVPKNRALTLRILQQFCGMGVSPMRTGETPVPRCEFEVGGGLRTAEIVSEYLAAGAARCIVGTKALEDRAFFKALAEKHPGRINLGLDAKSGKVVVRGWVSGSDVQAVDLINALRELPLGEVVYTDVARDGMLEGPNFSQLEQVLKVSPFPLIASGGVTTIEQIRRCREMGCFGAIVGKALYDGQLELSAALAAAG
jgi:phosphoribosylformimino-5-aminoimidazole carboxamide ribotide isomerase